MSVSHPALTSREDEGEVEPKAGVWSVSEEQASPPSQVLPTVVNFLGLMVLRISASEDGKSSFQIIGSVGGVVPNEAFLRRTNREASGDTDCLFR